MKTFGINTSLPARNGFIYSGSMEIQAFECNEVLNKTNKNIITGNSKMIFLIRSIV